MSKLQSSPPPSSWQKMTFTISDESTREMNLKVTFLLLPGFLWDWITMGRDMSYPLWFNFMSIGRVLKKLLSIGTLVNVWHQTLSSLQLLEKALQLLLDQLIPLACHPGHLSNTFSQGYRKSKKFGYWTSGSGGKKTVKSWLFLSNSGYSLE